MAQIIISALAGFCAALVVILLTVAHTTCEPVPIQPASIAMLMGPEL